MSKIATITAVYNRPEKIKRCLDSIVNQSRVPDKIIIIDDASTDDTFKSIQSWIKKYTNGKKLTQNKNIYYVDNFVVCIQDKNGGPSEARNKGLSIAMGTAMDYIQIVDSDDELHREKIRKSEQILDTFDTVGLVYSNYTVVTKDGSKKNVDLPMYQRMELLKDCVISNNSMYRLDLVNQVGGYDPQLGGAEDWDLWLRLTEASLGFLIPEYLYLYHLDDDNITVHTEPQQFNQWRGKVIWKLRERMKNVKQLAS